MRRFSGLALACFWALTGIACATSESVSHTQLLYVLPAAVGASAAPAATFGVPLQTGQIVLSEAPGAHSVVFSLGTAEFFPFTHSGLVVVDGDTGAAWVYDLAADYKPAFSSSPAAALHGGIRRAPFLDYLGNYLHVEIHEPPAGADRAKMAARIEELWRAKVKFDEEWDFSDHSKLFCTEFVSEVLVAGGVPAPALVDLTRNPSLERAQRFLGVKGDRTLPAGIFAGGKLVAAFGQWSSRAAAAAYFEAKHELHRRFTLDQRIGNVVAFEHHDLQIRPAVATFLDRSAHLFDGEPAPVPAGVVQDRVRRLADEVLGSFP